jgi:hypothetical protein
MKIRTKIVSRSALRAAGVSENHCDLPQTITPASISNKPNFKRGQFSGISQSYRRREWDCQSARLTEFFSRILKMRQCFDKNGWE